MKSIPSKDDTSTVRKRAKADASKDEEDDCHYSDLSRFVSCSQISSKMYYKKLLHFIKYKLL